jgi:hypothetical protein
MAKKQHGGKRPGAGRKPLDPDGSTLIGASLPTDLVEKLDAYAAKHESTRAQVIREAVRRFLAAK